LVLRVGSAAVIRLEAAARCRLVDPDRVAPAGSVVPHGLGLGADYGLVLGGVKVTVTVPLPPLGRCWLLVNCWSEESLAKMVEQQPLTRCVVGLIPAGGRP
jgi:hypothetical protein